MRTFSVYRCLLLFTALSLLAPISSLSAPNATIPHHDLEVELHPWDHLLTVRDVVSVDSGGRHTLVLEISPSARMGEILVDGNPAQFNLRGDRLFIDLSTSKTGAANFSIVMTYDAVFDDPVPSNPVHSEDPSYGVSATISSAGVFLGGGAGWHPVFPGVPATYSLRVRAPANWTAVTAGRFLGTEAVADGNLSRWEISQPLESLSLAAGPYRVASGGEPETPLYTFFFAPETDLASDYLHATEKYLNLYKELLGPYPFPKFAVAENFFPTGYGFPSWTLLGSAVVRLPFIIDTSLPHEIAHSWWGNGVRVYYRGGNWSEGLTTYVSDYYLKELTSPAQGRAYRLKILRDYASLVAPGTDSALDRFTTRNSAAGQAVGYGKAAMVFHMIRREIGDQPFWAGLRAVAGERMFRETSWDDFQEAFSASSGRDLAPFVRQWVTRPGAPSLSLQDLHLSRKGDHWEVSGTLLQKGPALFFFQIPLHVETATGASDTLLRVREQTTSFVLSSRDRPLSLQADPECHLFRRLDPSELPPTVNGTRGASSLVVILSDGFSEDFLPVARLLLSAMRQESARIIREKEVSPKDLDNDLLFLGLPARKELRPPIPPLLDVSQTAIHFDGRLFTGAGTVLFAALPHPRKTGGSAALFQPFSSEGGMAAARKIPHYGKYSYLIFDNGTNRIKGVWEPPISPLRVLFSTWEKNP